MLFGFDVSLRPSLFMTKLLPATVFISLFTIYNLPNEFILFKQQRWLFCSILILKDYDDNNKFLIRLGFFW